jgi:hypothetical protein
MEAEAHWMLRLYHPGDERLTDERHKALTLGRVCLAMALNIERGDNE